MNWSLAELRRRLKANPQVTLESPTALQEARSGTQTPRAVYDAADELLARLRVLAPDLPLPIRDLPFETFRIDLAWKDQMFAVEVDGGQHKPGGGKHGSKRDYQKTRRLTLAGWRLLRFTAGEVRDDPLAVIDEIREALCTTS